MARPVTALVIGGACARTSGEARRLLQLHQARAERLVRNGASSFAELSEYSFCGTASECKEQIEKLVLATAVDEVIISPIAPTLEGVLETFELLSEVLPVQSTTAKI
jgi:alkanesulfonate monooxygenase SsuD/methylene tetrahydromethanopterin reductase-like flavin-dependent oxidoreductase (luciferase family)